uniref:Ribosomal protein eL8/eL30/eS12/Gadd45 domain-containing protein n=1 Tax=Castor canadensis TaxID=51338 RepID=A0A8C0W6Z5_CASCN
MVTAKKMKKSVELMNSRLQLALKSGKHVQGYKQTLRMNRQGNVKLAILTNNCLALRNLKYYAVDPNSSNNAEQIQNVNTLQRMHADSH